MEYTLEQKRTLLPDRDHLSLRIRDAEILVLDQKLLPYTEDWLRVDTLEDMWKYVETLAIRGAPLIGCSCALVLASHAIKCWPANADIVKAAQYLRGARPTAVNLMYCCDQIAQVHSPSPDYSPENICKIALQLVGEDARKCEAMAEYGASLIQEGDHILHHCNTGALATMGIGTALGVIKKAHQQQKKIHVYVDETRPLLQGGRLTTYELEKEGIPYTLICDNMAASLMRDGKIQRVFVGADRIAMNGDFANKIGTYNVAVIAKHHGVPFHPVAPISTVDFECETGAQIPIEERNPAEVRGAFGVTWAPHNSPTFNPAFDVTPGDLITSLVLDKGIFSREDIASGALRALKEVQ